METCNHNNKLHFVFFSIKTQRYQKAKISVNKKSQPNGMFQTSSLSLRLTTWDVIMSPSFQDLSWRWMWSSTFTWSEWNGMLRYGRSLDYSFFIFLICEKQNWYCKITPEINFYQNCIQYEIRNFLNNHMK